MNCRVCGSELPDGAMFCGECGSSVTATRLQRPEARDERPSDTTIIEPLPGPAVSGRRSKVHSVPIPDRVPEPVSGAAGEPATESTPTTASVDAGVREPAAPTVAFVFAVSTGERVTITGGGLLGRRPIAQPGEHVAEFVSIADTGRSVSKTHLEFGIEAGQLWVCDRYSANGTVIQLADSVARLCEPGRRYRVERGSRVLIGDQYIDVT